MSRQSRKGRKLPRRRNDLEYFDSIKPPSHDESDKDFPFFQEDSHCNPHSLDMSHPQYLELPIKLQQHVKPISRSRLRDSSFDSSEHVDIYCETPEKNPLQMFQEHGKGEMYDLMMNLQREDAVDSLLMDQDHFQNLKHQINQFLMLEPSQVKQEDSDNLQRYSNEISRAEDNYKSLLLLINDFRTFTQTLSLAMNYYRLLKKNSTNKNNFNALNLLARESQKLHVVLENERVRLGQQLSKKRDEGKCVKEEKGSQELQGTHAGSARGEVKEEQS